MRRAPLLLAALAALAGPRDAAADEDVLRFTLGNGLRCVLRDTRRDRAAGLALRFPLGPVDEPAGAAGAARLLLRLRLADPGALSGKGVTTTPEILGDALLVSFTLPQTSYLGPVLEEEAGRLRELQLADDRLARAGEAIAADLGKPASPVELGKLALSAVSQALRHARKEIALRDAERIPVESLRALEARHLGPEGALLAVVGDGRHEEARALIERHLAPVPARSEERPPPPEFPHFPSGRREVAWDGPRGGVALAFPIDAATPMERIVLTLFGNLLAARLEGRIPEGEGFPLTTSTQFPPGRLPFLVWQELRQGASHEALEGSLRRAVSEAVREPFPDPGPVVALRPKTPYRFEVERNQFAGWIEGTAPGFLTVPKGFEAAPVFAKDARDTCAREALHGGNLKLFLDTLRSVTPEGFLQAVRRYLRPEAAAAVWVTARG